jgi:hypothetical protein
MEDISVTLEVNERYLDRLKALAGMEGRTFPEQTALLLEKGVSIAEIGLRNAQGEGVIKTVGTPPR